MATAAFRTCPLCEATCGLELTIEEGKVTKVRGDKDDVLSHGFICPKGANIGVLHDDPDRLRTPMMRGADGELAPCSWDEAFAFIDERFSRSTPNQAAKPSPPISAIRSLIRSAD